MYTFYPSGFFARLEEDEIFAFGSNIQGIHGAGAAKYAKLRLGAIQGQGFGRQGQCFAIPTRELIGKKMVTLPLERIVPYVDAFRRYTQSNDHLSFLVTPLGTGLAKLEDKDIAPLFKGCVNCRFSTAWQPYLLN